MILPAKSAALFGEVAQARFRALAAALGAETKVTIEPAPSHEGGGK
jgi:hypothetical protein